MKNETLLYGCIDEDTFTLRSPRGIDGDECQSLSGAMRQAIEMIENGVKQVAIVRCRYSARHESWVEVPGAGTIMIDGSNWPDEDEEDEIPGQSAASPA